MYAGKKALQGLPDDDPEWIKEIFQVTNKGKLTDEDKKMIRELYHEYIRDGLDSRDALEKAKSIVLCFEK